MSISLQIVNFMLRPNCVTSFLCSPVTQWHSSYSSLWNSARFSKCALCAYWAYCVSNSYTEYNMQHTFQCDLFEILRMCHQKHLQCRAVEFERIEKLLLPLPPSLPPTLPNWQQCDPLEGTSSIIVIVSSFCKISLGTKISYVVFDILKYCDAKNTDFLLNSLDFDIIHWLLHFWAPEDSLGRFQRRWVKKIAWARIYPMLPLKRGEIAEASTDFFFPLPAQLPS